MDKRTCAVDGCGRTPIGWDFCARHYRNWRFTRDPLTPPIPWQARFMTKIGHLDGSDCWMWLGALNPETGYGYFNQEGTIRLAHQVAYELGHGPMPAGLEPDHTCVNRPCVNWDHLEAVTHRENVLRSNSPAALQARSEVCPNDHHYTPANTLIIDGNRRCAICLYAKQERRNRTKREARARRYG